MGRKTSYGYCEECNKEFEWVDIDDFNSDTSESVIVYCETCGNELPITFKGELQLTKGLTFDRSKDY